MSIMQLSEENNIHFYSVYSIVLLVGCILLHIYKQQFEYIHFFVYVIGMIIIIVQVKHENFGGTDLDHNTESENNHDKSNLSSQNINAAQMGYCIGLVWQSFATGSTFGMMVLQTIISFVLSFIVMTDDLEVKTEAVVLYIFIFLYIIIFKYSEHKEQRLLYMGMIQDQVYQKVQKQILKDVNLTALSLNYNKKIETLEFEYATEKAQRFYKIQHQESMTDFIKKAYIIPTSAQNNNQGSNETIQNRSNRKNSKESTPPKKQSSFRFSEDNGKLKGGMTPDRHKRETLFNRIHKIIHDHNKNRNFPRDMNSSSRKQQQQYYQQSYMGNMRSQVQTPIHTHNNIANQTQQQTTNIKQQNNTNNNASSNNGQHNKKKKASINMKSLSFTCGYHNKEKDKKEEIEVLILVYDSNPFYYDHQQCLIIIKQQEEATQLKEINKKTENVQSLLADSLKYIKKCLSKANNYYLPGSNKLLTGIYKKQGQINQLYEESQSLLEYKQHKINSAILKIKNIMHFQFRLKQNYPQQLLFQYEDLKYAFKTEQVMKEIQEELSFPLKQHNILLDVNFDPDTFKKLNTDKPLVKQAIINVLSTAIKNSIKNSKISMYLKKWDLNTLEVQIVYKVLNNEITRIKINSIANPSQENPVLFKNKFSSLGLIVSNDIIRQIGPISKIDVQYDNVSDSDKYQLAKFSLKFFENLNIMNVKRNPCKSQFKQYSSRRTSANKSGRKSRNIFTSSEMDISKSVGFEDQSQQKHMNRPIRLIKNMSTAQKQQHQQQQQYQQQLSPEIEDQNTNNTNQNLNLSNLIANEGEHFRNATTSIYNIQKKSSFQLLQKKQQNQQNNIDCVFSEDGGGLRKSVFLEDSQKTFSHIATSPGALSDINNKNTALRRNTIDDQNVQTIIEMQRKLQRRHNRHDSSPEHILQQKYQFNKIEEDIETEQNKHSNELKIIQNSRSSKSKSITHSKNLQNINILNNPIIFNSGQNEIPKDDDDKLPNNMVEQLGKQILQGNLNQRRKTEPILKKSDRINIDILNSVESSLEYGDKFEYLQLETYTSQRDRKPSDNYQIQILESQQSEVEYLQPQLPQQQQSQLKPKIKHIPQREQMYLMKFESV